MVVPTPHALVTVSHGVSVANLSVDAARAAHLSFNRDPLDRRAQTSKPHRPCRDTGGTIAFAITLIEFPQGCVVAACLPRVTRLFHQRNSLRPTDEAFRPICGDFVLPNVGSSSSA
jgi:hypothetical protein